MATNSYTRRLHVSGLTPAISRDDLSARFAVFGDVKAIDDFGKLDALGQPRKFAFISLEASNDKHVKCLNVLSGSTWKGAKLRIGEAKPDYAQRLEKERMQEVEPKLKRRRLARGVQGVESRDMSLVTPENVENRPAWKRTALSHLVLPVRMRPLHPIGRPQISVSAISQRKKKQLRPLTRARRQKIDPTRYGAVHLTEEMLQVEQIVIPTVKKSRDTSQVESSTQVSKPKPQKTHANTASVSKTPIVHIPSPDAYIAEKQKDLSLLAQLFNGTDDWTGREDDVEETKQMSEDGEYDEDVPMEPRHISTASEESSPQGEETAENQEDVGTEESEESELEQTPPIQRPSTLDQVPSATRLKDLFSTPAQAPISILEGLELDLSLDEDLAFDVMQSAEPAVSSAPEAVRALTNEPKPKTRRNVLEGLQVSTTTPYFFPLTPEERSRGAIKDIMAVSQMRGWANVFLNPPSSEEIKRKWETERLALTRDWKQRHREAVKSQRRGAVVNGQD